MRYKISYVTMIALIFLAAPLMVNAQNVSLQATSPGTQQTGHMNISGNGIFGTAINIGSGTGFTTKGLNINRAFSTRSNVYGVNSYCSNASSGMAFGAYFSVGSSGTGTHCGMCALGYGTSNASSYGVYGYGSNTSTGDVYGGYFVTTSSGTGWHTGLYGYGNANSLASATGVQGNGQNSGSGDAYGGYFVASSNGTGVHYGVYASEAAGGNGAAIYAAGDLIVSGSKHAVVKTSRGHRLFYAQESTENWFEDFGQSRLVNGKAYVELDQHFLEAVTITNEHPMKVFVQLTSEEPMNVVVIKGATGFDVIAEKMTSAATFDYRIVAKRKGYENARMEKTDVGYDDPTLYPERLPEIEKKIQRGQNHNMLNLEQQEQEQESILNEANGSNLVNWNELPDASLNSDIVNDPLMPQSYNLNQNQPNPFNPSTVIQFDVIQPGRVMLKIYNNLGQEVATLIDQELSAGQHSATFDASGLPSGTYFSRLSVNGINKVKKMQLIK